MPPSDAATPDIDQLARHARKKPPGLTDREKAILSLPKGVTQEYTDGLSIDEMARLVTMHDRKVAERQIPVKPKDLPFAVVRRRAREEAEKVGIFEEESFHDVDKSKPMVQVRGETLKRRGLDIAQVAAAERFGRDFELAEFSGLRCKGFEPGVDGSKSHSVHLAQQDARIRLSQVKTALGERDYALVVAVILGFSVRTIHAAGGEQHKVVSDEIKVAFNKLVGFYGGKPRKDRTLKTLEGLIAAYYNQVRAELNGQRGNPEILAAAAREYETEKARQGRPRHGAKKATKAPRPENSAPLAQSVVDSLVSWGRLNLVQIDSFSLVAERDRHGMKAFATRNDKEISQTIFVLGPYLRAAIDAQLLKAALKMKWKERTS